MADMKLHPVFTCRGCSAPVVVTQLSTFFSDPAGDQLKEWMDKLSMLALCPRCNGRYVYLSSQGRLEEIEQEFAPRGKLLTVYSPEDTHGNQ